MIRFYTLSILKLLDNSIISIERIYCQANNQFTDIKPPVMSTIIICKDRRGESVFEESFRKRLIGLRMEKDVSARDMSLSMGQSEGYINKIESGHSLPSLTGFFYICDYFRISPKEFFDDGLCYPPLLTDLMNHLKALNHKQLENILSIVKDMKP